MENESIMEKIEEKNNMRKKVRNTYKNEEAQREKK